MTTHLEKLLDELTYKICDRQYHIHRGKDARKLSADAEAIRQRIIDLFEGRTVIAADEEAFAKSSATALKLDDHDDEDKEL